jgi:ribosome biogenesis protein ERB1
MHEEDRPFNFLPASFSKMRHIPFYDRLIQERFQRCLDLYLCPRIKKKKLNIDPDTLIPKLPDPKTLKPFPTAVNIIYSGHQHPVGAIAVSPSGEYLITGDESGLLIIWETVSSRIMFSKQFEQPILSVDWNRNNLIIFSHGEVL